MRTAEDIIREYRDRGYDNFRMRAIAALRPEPMRSQILAMLDQEDAAASAKAEAAKPAETPAVSAVESADDVMARTADELLASAGVSEPESAELPPDIELSVNSAPEAVVAEHSVYIAAGEAHPAISAEADSDAAAALAQALASLESEEDAGQDALAATIAAQAEVVCAQAEEVKAEAQTEVVVEKVEELGIFASQPAVVEKQHEIDILEQAAESAIKAIGEQAEAIPSEEAVAAEAEVKSLLDLALGEAQAAAPAAQGFEAALAAFRSNAEVDSDPPSSAGEIMGVVGQTHAEANPVIPEISAVEMAEANAELDRFFARAENEAEAKQVEVARERLDDYAEEAITPVSGEFFGERVGIAEQGVLTQDVLEVYRQAIETFDNEWDAGAVKDIERMLTVEASHAEPAVDAKAEDALEAAFASVEHEESRVIALPEVAASQTAEVQTSLFAQEEVEAEAETMVEMAENEREATASQLYLVEAQDDADEVFNSEKADDESKIIRAFEEEEIEAAAESANLHVVNVEGESGEWCDVGESGNIVFPKSLMDQHVAYDKAMHGTVLPAMEASTVRRSLEAGAQGSFDEAAARRDIMELERAVADLEAYRSAEQARVQKLSALLAGKDEAFSLQHQQIEEMRNNLAEKDAHIRELRAAVRRLHDLESEILTLKAERDSLEREQNILKGETIPALEEQQLHLVEVMEEGAVEVRKMRGKLFRSRLAGVGGYSLTAAAIALFACAPALMPGLGLGRDAVAPSNQVVINPNDSSMARPAAIIQASAPASNDSLAKLEDEKKALHALLDDQNRKFTREKAELQRQIKEIREDNERRSLALVSDMSRSMRDARRATETSFPVTTTSDSGSASRGTVSTAAIGGSSSERGSVTQPASTTQAAGGKVIVHKIKSGDTLTSIVKQYVPKASSETIKKIAEENGITNPRSLKIDKEIKISDQYASL